MSWRKKIAMANLPRRRSTLMVNLKYAFQNNDFRLIMDLVPRPPSLCSPRAA